MCWHFGPFRLDPGQAELWCAEQRVPLRPKTLALLAALVHQAGQVVTKEALLDAVWPETAVGDGVLKTCMSELRKVLGETGKAPQYIATVARRGYRFVAPVTLGAPTHPCPTPAVRAAPLRPLPPPPRLIAREAELASLHGWYATALKGERQVGFITGEAGIGKTALVEAFVAQLAPQEVLWYGQGQCIEQYGTGEAYLPLLAALGQLGRTPEGPHLVALLRHQAPTWLLQLPALLAPGEAEALQRAAGGATRERMLRELAEAVETLTATRPLVLVLEDLHWSDTATIEWLAYVARRRVPARFLVLGTYRPVEAIVRAHPVHAMVQELLVHRQGAELPLREWAEAGVAAYLAQWGAGAAVPAALVRALTARTDGHPLFVVTVVEELVRQGRLQVGPTGWEVAGGLEAVTGVVPPSLRHLLASQVAQLAPADQALLAAASVAGVEFAVAAVAAGLAQAEEEVDAQCDAVARQSHLLQPRGPAGWPDGTVTARYGFRHAVYQELLYAQVPVSRRARWHRQMGQRLAAGYGAQADEIAAELAEHFVRGQEPHQAVHYLARAAVKAAQRYAHHAVTQLGTQALALLRQLPETPARAQHELELSMTLGSALVAIKGHAAPEVQQTYTRAYTLCHQVPESPQLPQILVGLWLFHSGRGDHATAQEMGEHLLRLAHRGNDPVALLYAHGILGLTAFYRGDVVAERDHLEHSITLDEGLKPYPPALGTLWDFGVVCRIGTAGALQQLGYSDQARQREAEALVLTQRMASPYNRCNLLLFLTLVQCFRREARQAQPWVEEALSLARAEGFLLLAALGTMVQGAILTMQGQAQAGLAHLRQGFAACHTLGTQQLHPWGVAMLAESYARLGQPEVGLTALAATPALMATTGDVFYAAEIARLEGELRVQAGGRGPALGPDPLSSAAAERCFQHAVDVAHRRQARWWELRAALSLSRLWQQQGKRTEARALLAPIYGWFTEGFDTADLQEAQTLLDELGG